MRRLTLVAVLGLLTLVPASLEAQSAWDGPSLVSPYAPQGLGLFLVGNDPSGAVGLMASWRRDRASMGVAYRGGFIQADNDATSAYAGVDVSGILARGVDEADIAVSWWTGLGGSVGDDLLVSIPLGLVAAWQGLGDGNVFAPYVGGHVSLDVSSRDGDTLAMDASLDLGLDLGLVSGWVVRFGASLFGRGSVGIGVRIPG